MKSVQQILLIAIFGAVGSVARYGVNVTARVLFGESFPIGTLIANLLGCLLIGFVVEASLLNVFIPRELRLPITVGFLGAFTTFSTFSYDTLRFIEHDAFGLAAANVLANVLVGGVATLVGMATARALGG